MALGTTVGNQQASEAAKSLEVLQMLREKLPNREVYDKSSLGERLTAYNAAIDVAGARGFALFQKYKNNLLNGSLVA